MIPEGQGEKRHSQRHFAATQTRYHQRCQMGKRDSYTHHYRLIVLRCCALGVVRGDNERSAPNGSRRGNGTPAEEAKIQPQNHSETYKQPYNNIRKG